jgi:hypothetical protein
MNKVSTHHPYSEERRLFYIALMVLAMSFCLYAYFVSASVVHVVMRKEVDREIAAQASYVSQLETQYIEAQHSVSEDIASLKGFTSASKKIFIDARETTLVLNSN